MKKKYLKTLFLGSQSFVIFSLGFSLNNINIGNNHLIEKKEDNDSIINDSSNKNYQTNFNITPIYKSGKDRLVWLIFGEGYKVNEQDNFVNDAKETIKDIFNISPYKEFSPYINIYAINVISDNNWIIGDNKKRTYFNSFVYSGQRYVNLHYFGSTRLKILREQIMDSYLDEGATYLENTVLVNNKTYYGGANFEWYSTMIFGNNYNQARKMLIHEASHGFAFLEDEYALGDGFREGVNRTSVSDLNKIKWKKFVGYKNVGAHLIENSYTPTPYGQCIMSDLNAKEFCPVCKYEIHRRLNQMISNQNEYFLLDPEITTNYDSSTGQSKLKFVTVFRNYTNKNKKIKVNIKNGNATLLTETFDVLAGDLEQLLINENSKTKIDDYSNIVSEIIDIDSNKIIGKGAVLESNKQKTFDITLNFKIEGSNENIPSIQNSTIKVIEGNDYLIDPPTIEGYKFVRSNLSESKISNVTSNSSIDYFYTPIEKKNIQIVVKNELGNEIIRKVSTIYKSEYFIPKKNDLQFHYGWLVEPTKQKYKYDEILPNQEIEYIRKENYPIINLKKSDFEIGNKVGIESIASFQKMNGEIPSDLGGVEYIDWSINWDKIGTYPIEFWYTNTYIDEDSIPQKRKAYKKFYINIVDKNNVDNSDNDARNFINNDFVSSFIEPTKDNVEKILNSKNKYDSLDQNIKNKIDKIISEDNNNFKNFNSYNSIYNEVNNFNQKLNKMLNDNLFINNSYINVVNDNTYKKILNFENEFKNLKKNEKDFIDYKLSIPYEDLLLKSKNYNPIKNEEIKNDELKNSSNFNYSWVIILISLIIASLVVGILSWVFHKKNKR